MLHRQGACSSTDMYSRTDKARVPKQTVRVNVEPGVAGRLAGLVNFPLYGHSICLVLPTSIEGTEVTYSVLEGSVPLSRFGHMPLRDAVGAVLLPLASALQSLNASKLCFPRVRMEDVWLRPGLTHVEMVCGDTVSVNSETPKEEGALVRAFVEGLVGPLIGRPALEKLGATATWEQLTVQVAALAYDFFDANRRVEESYKEDGEGVLGRGAHGTVQVYTRLSDRKTVALKCIEATDETPLYIMDAIHEYSIRLVMEDVCRHSDGLMCPTAVFYDPSKRAIFLELPYRADLTKIMDAISQWRDNNEWRVVPFDILLVMLGKLVQLVQSLHSHNVFHNDLHKRNILASPDLTDVRIIDFGAACSTHDYRVRVCYAGPNVRNDIAELKNVIFEAVALARDEGDASTILPLHEEFVRCLSASDLLERWVNPALREASQPVAKKHRGIFASGRD
jgi:hypothetical protein